LDRPDPGTTKLARDVQGARYPAHLQARVGK
jgi:hypothetical protein